MNSKAPAREQLLYAAETTETERKDFRNALTVLKDCIGKKRNEREKTIDCHSLIIKIIFLMVELMIMVDTFGIRKHQQHHQFIIIVCQIQVE